MLTDAQRQARRQGLGGSDAAAVLGVSPWRTPLDVYLEKRGEAPPRASTEAMEWGVRLEAAVAVAAAERLHLTFRRRTTTLTHPSHPWMLAHLDREVVGQRALVEIKTTGFRGDDWGEEGSDQIPQHYRAQVAHYLAVRDYERAYVPVLFLGERHLAIYHVARDRTVEAALIEAERNFWHAHVLAGVPPNPTTLADVRKRWPHEEGGVVVATEDVQAALVRLREVQAEQAGLKREREALEAQIQTQLAAHATLTDATGATLVTRRVDLTALTMDHPALVEQYRRATTHRVFRLTTRKETP